MEAVTEWIRHRFPTVENVCADTLQQWLKEKPERLLLLDVRSPEEYQISHLQGAVRVDPETTDMDHLVKNLGLKGNAAVPVVVCYCTVGFYASRLAQEFRNILAGNSRHNPQSTMEIYNLEGGILKWANEKRALVDSDNRPCSLVHSYSELWAQLLRADFTAPWPHN